MSVSVTMPRLGESVSEGTVTRWLKKEGDQVEADEPLLEVSTDKVDTEIPSPAAGVLSSIKVGEDETVEVGSELAVIDEGGGADAKADEQESEPEEAAEPAQQDDDAEPAKDEQQREPEQDGEDEGESAASAEQREEVADDAAGEQSGDDGAADEKPARDAG